MTKKKKTQLASMPDELEGHSINSQYKQMQTLRSTAQGSFKQLILAEDNQKFYIDAPTHKY